jgi:hypothetical protein
MAMAVDFNPYHVWLGIPPEEQPANYYRLLGLRLFETSADVIDNAADRQMAHLRKIQVGKHSELSQRLLNEVAAARVCLLDPKKRVAYDRQLRASSTPPTAVPAPPAFEVPVSAAVPQPATPWNELLGDPNTAPAHRTGDKAVKAAAAKRAATLRLIPLGIAGAVLLVALVGFGLYSLTTSSDGTLVFDWPAGDRTGTTLKIDDTPLAIPAEGPWEYRGAAGSHHIVAGHLAYKLDTNVVVSPGEQQAVPPEWKPKAMLVLNWPLALRRGAELKIDGHALPISRREPLEVAVEPGRHQIQIVRPGFEPLVTSVVVAADGRQAVSIAPPPSPAKLVLDWPADERENAELSIDGERQTVPNDSGSAQFELTLKPGWHVVRITRTDFQPFNQIVELSAGTDRQLKPAWKPEHKTARTPTVAEARDPDPAPGETTPREPVQKPTGKGIDLLASVDPDRDTTKGHWTRQGSGIVSDDQISKVTFPADIAEDNYELLVEFSRNRGGNTFIVNFPVGDRGCSFVLCNKEGKYSGLAMIDGQRADGVRNPTVRSPSKLQNGRRYIARIKVEIQQKIARINCFLDDDELVAWRGNVDSVGPDPVWQIAPHRAGAGDWKSPSTIYSARLVK